MFLCSIRYLTPLAILSLFVLTSCGDPEAGGADDDNNADAGRDVRPAEADCGDGELQEGEECDDSNRTNGDGCSRECLFEPAELCAPCASDDDCGREVDWCVRVDGERVCARDCSQEACPTGYVCSPVTREDGRVAGQCLPERGICGGCADADTDGVCDENDVCAGNDDTIDADSDGIPDGCDVCAAGDDDVDRDSDGAPDACDTCPDDADRSVAADGPCQGGGCTSDSDGDSVCDDVDACPGGDDRFDGDADGVPNACDLCGAGDDALDSDSDGVPNACDKCDEGDDGVDTDGDGTADACDTCPNDATREVPADGPCETAGCTSDADDDSVCDDVDACPGGDDRLDADGDDVPNQCDVCAGGDDANDADSDTIPDTCDICAGEDDTIDTDDDGAPDACDTCPDDPDRAVAADGPCGGVVCTADADGDGFCDDVDRCAGGDDRLDTDGDRVPDACDECPEDSADDSDGDGNCDSDDICPAGDDTLDTDLDGTPDACDACPDSALGDSDDDGVCDDEDLCLLGDDTIDVDRDGVPDACEPSAGSYVYERVPIGGLGNQAAVAFHPSNDWALMLQRTELVRVVQTEDLTTESYDPPGSGSIYWQDLAFNPDGSVAILVGYRLTSGSSSTTGVVYRFDTETWATSGLATAVTALTPTAADRYMAVEFNENSGEFTLLSANGTGTSSYNVALRSYNAQANTFGFIAAQATGAGCSDFAFVNNEFGDPGTLIVCGENGYDAVYWTEVAGVNEWRLDLGNNLLGNTSRVAAHPSGNYALLMSWSGDAIYRFQGGLVNGYSAAPRFSTRRIWGAEFAPDGRRALIYGQYMSISGGAFFVVLEYRHDEYVCTAALTPSCELTEVSIRGADVAPWIAPSGARIADASWRSDCDGGLLVGGNSSFSGEYGLVATFQLEGGRPCW